MNITHLKYAVEIARTGSITQAAENLYRASRTSPKPSRSLNRPSGSSFSSAPRRASSRRRRAAS
ncbi:MAG: hypothetical protein ACLUFV_05280 [Acutalibacteraceae bacterium]